MKRNVGHERRDGNGNALKEIERNEGHQYHVQLTVDGAKHIGLVAHADHGNCRESHHRLIKRQAEEVVDERGGDRQSDGTQCKRKDHSVLISLFGVYKCTYEYKNTSGDEVGHFTDILGVGKRHMDQILQKLHHDPGPGSDGKSGKKRRDIGKRVLAADRVYKERQFNILHDKDGRSIIVQGIIDCYFEETEPSGDKHLILLDYKTNYDTTEIEKKYAEQMALYKEALEKSTGLPVSESYLYLFSEGRELKIG